MLGPMSEEDFTQTVDDYGQNETRNNPGNPDRELAHPSTDPDFGPEAIDDDEEMDHGHPPPSKRRRVSRQFGAPPGFEESSPPAGMYQEGQANTRNYTLRVRKPPPPRQPDPIYTHTVSRDRRETRKRDNNSHRNSVEGSHPTRRESHEFTYSMRSRPQAVNYREPESGDEDLDIGERRGRRAGYRQYQERNHYNEDTGYEVPRRGLRSSNRGEDYNSNHSNSRRGSRDYVKTENGETETTGRTTRRSARDAYMDPMIQELAASIDKGGDKALIQAAARRASNTGDDMNGDAANGNINEPITDPNDATASEPKAKTTPRISLKFRPKPNEQDNAQSAPVDIEGTGETANHEEALFVPEDDEYKVEKEVGEDEEEYKVIEESEEEEDDDVQDNDFEEESSDHYQRRSRPQRATSHRRRVEGTSDDEEERNRSTRRHRELERRRSVSHDNAYSYGRSLRPRRTVPTYNINSMYNVAPVELQQQQPQPQHESRSLRAARRAARFEVEDTDLLLDKEGLDKDNILTEGEMSAGKRLRPRKRQVDYTRQLHPGAGWTGQPLESIQAEIRAKESRFGRRSSRRDRTDDEGAINYRPGHYRMGHNQIGSDTDEDVLRRRPVSAGVSKGNSIEPINIMEILRVQEQALLKDMPEDERKKYEVNARIFRSSGGKDLADVDPVSVGNVSFESVGGLEEHIRSLKEMVVMPLLYPEIFSGFNIAPPRGVLFHGPPGTGKTLMARALAASCSTSTQKVAFFMRKGADVLSKWVGESERQLRLLFEQAKVYQPSIIFFDEIDGLAPVRSSKQDQIHASIVSTLLALMDGLDSRGQVVVIGATNRVDAIDPALRRPGRFDREFYFPLPPEAARKKIISITTKDWNPPLDENTLNELAVAMQGYGGADVKASCTEAALNAVRRTFPEIYDTTYKLQIDMSTVNVTLADFIQSMKRIVPSTQRSSAAHAQPIPTHIQPLVSGTFLAVLATLDVLCPLLQQAADAMSISFHESQTNSSQPVNLGYLKSAQPRLLICGQPGMGQSVIGPATLEALESRNFHIQSLDLPSLLHDSGRTADVAMIQLLQELRRHRLAVVYIPQIDVWWESIGPVARTVFVSMMIKSASEPVLIVATTEKPYREVDEEIRALIRGSNALSNKAEGWRRVIEAKAPQEEARGRFFAGIIQSVKTSPTNTSFPSTSSSSSSSATTQQPRPTLLRAPSPPPRKLTEAETEALFDQQENLQRQLRMELRFIVNDIRRQKRFGEFNKPVDPDLYPDYFDVVRNPMDLETLLWKINQNEYALVEEFVDDFECIVKSAEEYNIEGSAIVGKAYDLWDTCMMYIDTLKKREPEFVWELKQAELRCRLINEQRKREGLKPLGSNMRRKPADKIEAPKEKETTEAPRKSQRIRGEEPIISRKEAEELLQPVKNVSKRIVDDEDPSDFEEGGGGSKVGGGGSTSQMFVDLADDAATNVSVCGTVESTGAKGGEDSTVLDDAPLAASVDDGGVSSGSSSIANGATATPGPAMAATDVTLKPQPMNQPLLDTLGAALFGGDEGDTTTNNGNGISTAPQRQVSSEVPPAAAATAAQTTAMVPPLPPLLPEFKLDETVVFDLERRLVHETQGRSVAELEGLGVALSGVVCRLSHMWDRTYMVQELNVVLDRARTSWQMADVDALDE